MNAVMALAYYYVRIEEILQNDRLTEERKLEEIKLLNLSIGKAVTRSALYELLILGFLLPAFYFGWKWFYRVLAGVLLAKGVAAAKDKVMGKVKDNAEDAS